MECFGCFKRGGCFQRGSSYCYESPSGKVLHFCSKACVELKQREDVADYITRKLNDTLETVSLTKEAHILSKDETYTLMVKIGRKLLCIETLLYKAMLAEKPKPELNRLMKLYQEEMVEMLTHFGDHHSEDKYLRYADKAKLMNEILPRMIQILGK